MSWLCKDCGYETDNHTEYKLHLETHKEPSDLGIVPETATEKMIEREIEPVVQSTTASDGAKSVFSGTGAMVAPWSKEALAKQARGIVLQYKFDGVCPDCGVEVETLELPNLTETKKVAMVAYCVSCKKQLQTEVVTKL